MTFETWRLADNDHKWEWGTLDTLTFKSDGGALKGVYYMEDVATSTPKPQGMFAQLKLDRQTEWEQIVGKEHEDFLGVIAPAKLTRAQALKQLNDEADSVLTSHLATCAYMDQFDRYYSSAVQKKPPDFSDAPMIKKSGYYIRYDIMPGRKLNFILISRKARANRGADGGLVEDWDNSQGVPLM
jgi:hypothetical protein